MAKKAKATAKKATGAKKAKTKKAATKPKAMLSAAPPYKCETTDEPGTCLRFNRNPKTGQYNLPREGIRVNCTDCEFFFD